MKSNEQELRGSLSGVTWGHPPTYEYIAADNHNRRYYLVNSEGRDVDELIKILEDNMGLIPYYVTYLRIISDD